VAGEVTGFVPRKGSTPSADVVGDGALTLVDAQPGLVEETRGMTYHWAALAGLERLGLLEDAEAAGFLERDWSSQVLATGERIVKDLPVLDDVVRHPDNLVLAQDALSAVIMTRLQPLAAVSIRRDTAVIRLQP
jgi:3-(3-hydroxy-phenyl)propionate hydroxylase